MKNKLLLVFIFVFSISATDHIPEHALSIIDLLSEEIGTLLNSSEKEGVEKGLFYRDKNDFKMAIKSFKKAKKRLQKSGEWEQMLTLDNLIIDIYRRDNQNYYKQYSFKSELYKYYYATIGYAHKYVAKDTSVHTSELAVLTEVGLLFMKLDLELFRYKAIPSGKTENELANHINSLIYSTQHLFRILDDAYKTANELLEKEHLYSRIVQVLFEYDYTIAQIYEDIGMIYANAPIPSGLNEEEHDVYKTELEKYANQNYCAAISHCEKLLERISEYDNLYTPWHSITEEKIKTLSVKIATYECDHSVSK